MKQNKLIKFRAFPISEGKIAKEFKDYTIRLEDFFLGIESSNVFKQHNNGNGRVT